MAFRFTRRSLGLALTLVATVRPSWAADYPSRPIRLVVPYAAGGATDQLARSLGEILGRDLGQPFVIENRPGANTSLGAEAVSRSEADGHTLFLASGANMVLNPLLYRRLAYDPDRDLRLISLLAEVPLVVVVHPSVPAKTLAEFVAYGRVHGDRLNYASVGIGNPLHLAAERFKMASGVRMTHVPYRGSAPALTDLVSGQVQVMFDTISSSLPHIQAGNLRALAVTTPERVAQLPEVPTVAESGYPGYRATVWFGLAAPRQVPEAVATRLATGLARALTDETLRRALEPFGFIVQKPQTPDEIARFVAEERMRWAETIASNNITLD
ncbi:MAG: Bug family tripartite tricarboxylate transporter substrate binding protein [Phreatobacter sp.]